MNRLFESGIAGLLRHLKPELKVGGSPLHSVETQVPLGKLFNEYQMRVDVVLEGEDGRRVLLDTKYKSLQDHSGPSQSDLYQIHACTTAGDEPYHTVILLYPGMRFVARRYRSDAAKVYVRTINPRLFYDSTTGGLSQERTLHALNETLDV